MFDEIRNDTAHRMDQAVEHTRMELAKIRTGRANPELLNSIQVSYYGVQTPLNQIASITVREPRLITVQPFEKTILPTVERAILKSNLGLTPSNNGTQILIPVPTLSEERRQELIKYVHHMVEEGRIAVRNVRRDAIHHIKDYGKEEHISEDEVKRHEERVQELTNQHVDRMNALQEHKEKELLEY